VTINADAVRFELKVFRFSVNRRKNNSTVRAILHHRVTESGYPCLIKGGQRLHRVNRVLSDILTESVSRVNSNNKDFTVVATYLDPKLSGGFYNSWPSKGVEMRFDREGKLKHVILHSGRKLSPDCKEAKYTGELPEKLSFDDTMASVRRKLGQPEETFRGFVGTEEDSLPTVCATYDYPSKGILVGFDPRGFTDDIALIVRVIVYKPRRSD
jgi:hypothetical protein